MKLPLLLTALLLTACATPEPTPPAGRPLTNPISPTAAIVLTAYGQPTTFTGDKILRYPHFDLTFLGTRFVKSRTLPAHLLNFQTRNPSGRAVALCTWHPASSDPDTFFLDGRSYQFTVNMDTLQISIVPAN